VDCSARLRRGDDVFRRPIGYTFTVRPLLVLSIGVGGLVLVPAWYATLGTILRAAARGTDAP
jgi:hypothetical protein